MTITAAAFCPHPPLLVPEVGQDEPVAAREPAVAAVSWLAAQPVRQILVIGSGQAAASYPGGSAGGFGGYGVDRPVRLPGAGVGAGGSLPLSLAVGAWLLEAAGWDGPTLGLTCDPEGRLGGLSPEIEATATGLLVMGDGSARRSEKAPGWLDERSLAFDSAVSAALAAGDCDGLAVDLKLGDALLSAGAPVWTAAAGLLHGQRWSGQVTYDDAPYGVGYLVATWSAQPSP